MPNFKPKANKNFKVSNKYNITLDNKHHEKMNEFYNIKKNVLPKLKKEKKEIENKLKCVLSFDEKLELKDRYREINILIKLLYFS